MKLYISVINMLSLGVQQKELAAELVTTQGVISKKRKDPFCFVECEVKCKTIKFSDSPLSFVQLKEVKKKDKRAFFHRKGE